MSTRSELILGIDPGLSGAMALIDFSTKALVGLSDFTISRTGKHGEIYIPAVVATVKPHLDAILTAVIESNDPRPGNDLGSTWRFARGTGQIEGALLALGVRIVPLRPAVWKPLAGVTADKETSVIRAEALFPNGQFRGPRGGLLDGRAEAALMAWLWADRLARKAAMVAKLSEASPVGVIASGFSALPVA